MKLIRNNGDNKPLMLGRRDVIMAGASFAGTPLLSGIASGQKTPTQYAAANSGPFRVRAYGNTKSDAPLGAMDIQRRAVGPNDVLLDVLYCGICHSDIHQVRNEWKDWGPTNYPCVPGHEIIGRVVTVG